MMAHESIPRVEGTMKFGCRVTAVCDVGHMPRSAVGAVAVGSAGPRRGATVGFAGAQAAGDTNEDGVR